jgi:SM-20-related protein
MADLLLTRPPDEPYDRIAAELAGPGWSVCADFLPLATVTALAAELDAQRGAGGFRPAGIGVGAGKTLRPDIRCDQVLWLEEEPRSPAQSRYFAALEGLRLAINRHLYLGLFGFEGHMAWYPPGSFYRKHLDQFRAVAHRKVSVILYLNPHWQAQDGGELRLYLAPSGEGEYRDIAPLAGTLVVFLSDRFYHEVLPTRRPRRSLTGWFRVREIAPIPRL